MLLPVLPLPERWVSARLVICTELLRDVTRRLKVLSAHYDTQLYSYSAETVGVPNQVSEGSRLIDCR